MHVTIKRGTRVIGWSLLVVGVPMSYVGCAKTVGAVMTSVRGESADGVVTALRPRGFNSRTVMPSSRHPAEITFTTADGTVVTFHHPVGGRNNPFTHGERVRVLYEADAPEDAIASRALPVLLLGWGFLAVAGLVEMLTGAALLLVGTLPWSQRNEHTGIKAS